VTDAPNTPEQEVRLNALSLDEATEALARCCSATRWVEAMLARLPFASRAELFAAAAEVWARMSPDDIREAFAHHPEIGGDLAELRQKFAATADWASAEQGATARASEATLIALRNGNQAYRARFGYSFIVCATGKSADEMRALLEARLGNAPELELGIAAAEQAQITRLRLEKLEA
jgi:2-oxo-4-hydroxy-4-carboxy-5-ureidoimidazoline decarboxylase